MRTPKFTRRELELISDMAAIASAAEWGEGDYCDWEESDAAPYASLRKKIWDLLAAPARPAAGGTGLSARSGMVGQGGVSPGTVGRGKAGARAGVGIGVNSPRLRQAQ